MRTTLGAARTVTEGTLVSFLERLVLRTWLPPLLWAIDTPVEPMFSLRKRAEPVADDDITADLVTQLNAHVGRAASSHAAGLAFGAALIVWLLVWPAMIDWWVHKPLLALAVALHSGPERYLVAARLTRAVSAVAGAGMVILYVAFVAFQTARVVGGPLSSLDNRVLVALKRGTAGPRVLGLLYALPEDAAYRIYLAPLLNRTDWRA